MKSIFREQFFLALKGSVKIRLSNLRAKNITMRYHSFFLILPVLITLQQDDFQDSVIPTFSAIGHLKSFAVWLKAGLLI